jgi:hypothetical protein
VTFNPIEVHAFTHIAAGEGQKVCVYEASNSIRLARGSFMKIDFATAEQHQQIVDAINAVCAEIEATSNYGGGA